MIFINSMEENKMCVCYQYGGSLVVIHKLAIMGF